MIACGVVRQPQAFFMNTMNLNQNPDILKPFHVREGTAMVERLSELGEAFVEDHQHLTRGLNNILKALHRSDLQKAAQMAGELDIVAGPHIQFEEEVLYAVVAKAEGEEFVNKLYHEHQLGKDALKILVQSQEGKSNVAQQLTPLIENLEVALDHVLSCGTLLSHLTNLDEQTQEEMLKKLQECRNQKKRWTKLPDHDVDSK